MHAVSVWAKALLIIVFGMFAPLGPMIFAVAVLVILDLVLGVIAAKREGKAIVSYGIKRTVAKIALFDLAIIASRYVEVTFTKQLADALSIPMPLTAITASTIALAELLSILENITRLTGVDLKSALISRLQGKPGDKNT